MNKTILYNEFNLITDNQFNELIDKNGDDLWDLTRTMFDLNQIISPLYFEEQNRYFKSKELSLGVYIAFASTYDRCIITYVVSDNIFADKRNIKRNKYAIVADIYREDIVSYTKEGETTFSGVKPKITYKTIGDQSVIPVGGLIPVLLFLGAVKVGSKLEERGSRERLGVKYNLCFNYNGQIIQENILCDKEYEMQFDSFLSDAWTKEKPIRPEMRTQSEIQSKEGCFIATACYDDYNHPSVLVLRNFRDNFLAKKKSGIVMIKIYYVLSPSFARIISRRKVLKFLIRKLFIVPIVNFISKRSVE